MSAGRGYSDRALDYLRDHAISPEIARRYGTTEDAAALIWGTPTPRRRFLDGREQKASGDRGVSPELWLLDGVPDGPDSVLLCEGEPDALAAATAREGNGFLPGLLSKIVAFPGSALKEFPAEIARWGAAEVAVAFDGDGAGRKAEEGLLVELREAGVNAYSLRLPDGEDLADVLARLGEDGPYWLASALVEGGAVEEERPADPAAAGEGGRYDARRYDLSRLIAESSVEPPWRVEPLLADRHLTLLSATGGEGKTWLGLALAEGVAAGTAVAGLPSTPGRVVIFDAENGPYILGSRLAALAGGLDPERVAIYDAEGLRLTSAEDVAWMLSVIEAEQADLFVLDSMRTLAPDAAENDSDEMAPVVLAAKGLTRQSGAAGLMFIHRGDDPRKDFRGSSAIRDQTDLLYVLERDPRDPEAKTRRRLRPSKVRIASEPDPRWLKLEVWRGEVYVSDAEAFDPASPKRPVRDPLAAEIVAAIPPGASLTRPELARAVGRDRTDRTLRRAVDGLVKCGRLAEDRGRYRVAQEGGGNHALPPPATPPPGKDGEAPPAPMGRGPMPPGCPPDDEVPRD